MLRGWKERLKQAVPPSLAALPQSLKETFANGPADGKNDLSFDDLQTDKEMAFLVPWQPLDGDVWLGSEDRVRTMVLALSRDIQTFLTPPSDEPVHPTAKQCVVALREDPFLDKVRFKLVPRVVSEHDFWCHYFAHVRFIRRQALLGFDEDEADGEDEAKEAKVAGEPADAAGPPARPEPAVNLMDAPVADSPTASPSWRREVDWLRAATADRPPTEPEAVVGGGGGAVDDELDDDEFLADTGTAAGASDDAWLVGMRQELGIEESAGTGGTSAELADLERQIAEELGLGSVDDPDFGVET